MLLVASGDGPITAVNVDVSKKKGAILNTKASIAIMGILSVAWPLFLCKSPALSWNVSRHHSTLCVSFISYVGRPFHLFIPFNLFTVTKQNLLISSKAPSESLYAHSVAFSHSCIHTDTHTHRLVLFEQLCSALCMFISAIVTVLLSFLPLHFSIMSP